MPVREILVVVDMQNDFIDGSLGTKEAQALVPRLAEYIKNWEGVLVATLDTHHDNYLETLEGQRLPVKHCIEDTEGWNIHPDIVAAMASVMKEHPSHFIGIVDKSTFGSLDLPKTMAKYAPERIVVTGLCTGICVLNNAAILRAAFPDAQIAVPASLTECVTPESKKTALEAMKLLQIDVIE